MYRQGLILALEDADINLDGGELPPEEAVETVETVADDSAAVQAEGDEAAVTVAQVEDAVQGGEELEDIAEVATDAVESGEGLDEDAAEVAAIAVESIRARLGFPRGRTLPATESFGQTSTRLASTKLVIESIGDTIKQIWAAIKAAAQRLWDKIKSFFAKLFNSTTMLAKLVGDLKARAAKLPNGAKPKEKEISHSGVARAFSIKGKADFNSTKSIIGNTSRLAGAAEAFGNLSKDVAAAAESLASGEINEASVKKFLAAKDGAAAKVASLMSSAFSVADGDLSVASKPKADKGGKSTTNFYGPFIGHSVLALTVSELSVMGVTTKTFTIAIEGGKGKAAEKVAALTVSEIQEAVSIAQKMLNSLADWKKVQSNYDAITKAQVKVADTVMSNAQKLLDKTGSSSETRQGLAELKESVNSTIQALGAFGARAPGLGFQMVKSLADYASISIRNLETGK